MSLLKAITDVVKSHKRWDCFSDAELEALCYGLGAITGRQIDTKNLFLCEELGQEAKAELRKRKYKKE